MLRKGELRRRWSVPVGVPMVAAVREDADGTLWLGTWEGLFRLKGNSTTVYTTAQGLAHDRATALVDDGRGSLWLGSPAGISRVDKKELEEVAAGRRQRANVETLDRGDGMRNPEVNAAAQPNACRTRAGDLWFATRSGVVQVSPARLSLNRFAPPVSVEGVDADGLALPLTRSEIAIPAGTRRVTLNFTAASLLAPEKARFRYRLEGFDREWVDSGRREATYTRLAAGRYTFRVLAANNDGFWTESPAVIRLRQEPQLYERGWFLAASVALVLGTVLAIHRRRIQRHVRIEQELDRRVKAALSEVQQLTGLLPICAWCKKIRDDSGYWNQIESYVRERSQAEFTHAICPDCAARMREQS
jgi:ligand-binding sensor domain-containing protein